MKATIIILLIYVLSGFKFNLRRYLKKTYHNAVFLINYTRCYITYKQTKLCSETTTKNESKNYKEIC